MAYLNLEYNIIRRKSIDGIDDGIVGGKYIFRKLMIFFDPNEKEVNPIRNNLNFKTKHYAS